MIDWSSSAALIGVALPFSAVSRYAAEKPFDSGSGPIAMRRG